MLLATLFCLGDINTVLGSSTGYPFMEMFRQAVGHNGGALTMAAIVVILNLCATISFVATASRMTWSFARDRGIPGWRYLSKVMIKSASTAFWVLIDHRLNRVAHSH